MFLKNKKIITWIDQSNHNDLKKQMPRKKKLQTCDLDCEVGITSQKANKNNNDAQFLTIQMQKDKIEKKINQQKNLKKFKKPAKSGKSAKLQC